MSRAELVRKLMAHAESARACGSESEAIAFAAKAAEIAAAEGLSPEDLQERGTIVVRVLVPHELDRHSRREGTFWCRYSVTRLGEHLGLQVFSRADKVVLHLAGDERDIQAAQPVLAGLVYAVLCAAKARRITALQSFEQGVALGIFEQLEMARIKQPNRPGLVRLNLAARAATEWLQTQVKALKDNPPPTPKNMDAARAGRAYGQRLYVPPSGRKGESQ